MRTLLVVLLAALAPVIACAQEEASIAGARFASIQPAEPFWHDFRRGWHFYEDPEPEVPVTKATPPRAAKAAAVPEALPPELLQFERLQKELEQYRHIAIINPSEANVRRYMVLEAKVVRQASYFADVAQRVAWSTPELDMTLEGRPVNAQAIEVYDREEARQRTSVVANLGNTHVLFFFFRSDCPYCHAFAPTLAEFEQRHGIPVVPISVDGAGLPTFPQFRRDNGIAKTLQVTQVPAVFLAEPFTGKITPIGYGVLSEAQLLERISTVASPGADALVPSVSRRVSLP